METVKQIQRNNTFKNLSGIVLSVDRTLIEHEKKSTQHIHEKINKKQYNCRNSKAYNPFHLLNILLESMTDIMAMHIFLHKY
ncbi:MAG: hypothetical protein LBC20_08920 [Planctomycetaceae bacterium]|jgi:hypothetical protein|nr:hypothetical protein [Planctomycetaceae bacterium]